MRLFVAVDPPSVEVERIAGLLDRMRRDSPRAGWCRREQLHATLKFLGEVDEVRRGEVEGALAETAATSPPFEIAVAAPGAFPDSRRPRVLWLGFEPAAPLVALMEVVERSLAPLGFPGEGRLSVPHLTLARMREPWPRGAGERWVEENAKTAAGAPFRVDRFRLVRSHLGPGGARYETLREFPLGG